MRRHAWLLVLAALVAVGKAVESPPSARARFPLRVHGKFLEPGSAVPRSPLSLVGLRETKEGGLEGTASAWFVPVEFEASRDLLHPGKRCSDTGGTTISPEGTLWAPPTDNGSTR
ncbi:MAG: hypothetical protein AUJ52_04530 [Elusimicrobia bacterium CG1_02_63_36]|nr:MAG: hypothetical protein AUJ52_04530 [Elusimicrobia bacterium CG1_02_63_36]PIP81650.1 MAG: hypothetical protein COR54_19210 [Elusimicrobia bacterium CG22_combo_CG10-13_8_21_14_all_63_91]PJA14215.1 MAG: hypothetical protein COX66_12845 [Elusimicrobia bacterium CG_4_10_14_0_2_um_filter_63_34]PJB24594.1 MAG: hypothetical protein CO113_12880 [Elusimicrobia bacterium CG_4_9_14_3_um_filter_62_55]